MKMRYTFFQLPSERAWVPSDVPICSCITSSALSYCAVEQGLFFTCRPVAGVTGAEAFLFGAAGPPR